MQSSGQQQIVAAHAFLRRNLVVAILFEFLVQQGTAMAVEEPAFAITLKEGAFELRNYPALVAAEVSVSGDRNKASSSGFRVLAAYIFGANTRRQSIAMTAPVVQAETKGESIAITAPVILAGSPGAWTVRFIMPSAYSLATLPKPAEARVRLLAFTTITICRG
jgi:SOUL heme-binding protein